MTSWQGQRGVGAVVNDKRPVSTPNKKLSSVGLSTLHHGETPKLNIKVLLIITSCRKTQENW